MIEVWILSCLSTTVCQEVIAIGIILALYLPRQVSIFTESQPRSQDVHVVADLLIRSLVEASNGGSVPE